jgi:integrase
VHRVRAKLADGSIKIYYYAWRGGPKLDPEDLVGSYAAAIAERRAQRALAQNSTITAALLAQYASPDEYQGRSAKWFKEKIRHIDILRQEFGEDEIEVFDDPAILSDIYDFRNTMRGTPTKANHVLGELTAFLNWCKKRGLISKNLAAGVDRFPKAKRAHLIWTDRQVEELCAHATPAVALVARGAALTGLDRADLVALNWSAIGEDGFIRGRRVKTQELFVIPVYDALAELLGSLERIGPKILVNGKGQPWTADGFSTGFRRAKIAAGIEGLRFKDLRGTAATYFYRRGLDDEAVAEIMGWTEDTCKEIRKEYVTDAARADGLIVQLNKARTKL